MSVPVPMSNINNTEVLPLDDPSPVVDLNHSECPQVISFIIRESSQVFKLSRKAALLSDFVSAALCDDPKQDTITIPSIVSENVVREVIKYLEYHSVHGFKKFRFCPVGTSSEDRLIIECRRISKYVRDPWDVQFVSFKQFKSIQDGWKHMQNLWHLSNYLSIKPLQELTSLKQATVMFNQQPPYQRWVQGLKNDWDPVEYRKARQECQFVIQNQVKSDMLDYLKMTYVPDSDDDCYDSSEDTDSDLDVENFDENGLKEEIEIESDILAGKTTN